MSVEVKFFGDGTSGEFSASNSITKREIAMVAIRNAAHELEKTMGAKVELLTYNVTYDSNNIVIMPFELGAKLC